MSSTDEGCFFPLAVERPARGNLCHKVIELASSRLKDCVFVLSALSAESTKKITSVFSTSLR